MRWIQLRLIVDREGLEAVEQALEDLGSQSCSQKDADDVPWFESTPGEAPPWRRIEVRALFPQEIDRAAISSRLKKILGPGRSPSLFFEEIADRDWLKVWMEEFKPMRFGERLWVCPTFAEPPEPAAVHLRLDPGHAFGTGTHPSTALCLEWLDAGELAGLEVLDYGCGSGILAIAALLLGARQAWACDIDPQALDATAANARTNGVTQRLHVCRPEELPDLRADLLVANILAEPLKRLAAGFARLQSSGATLLLAGVLAGQVGELLAHYARAYTIRQVASRDEWALLEGVRI